MQLYPQTFSRRCQCVFGAGSTSLLGRNENCHTRKRRDELGGQLQALGEDFETSKTRHSSHVPARACQIRDKANIYGIEGDQKDERDLCPRLLYSQRQRRAPGDQRVHAQANDLCRKRRHCVLPPACVSVFNSDVLVLRPAMLSQTFFEGFVYRIGTGRRRKITDARNVSLLLCICRERPRRRAADERDELAPS
jgi:hypothetical protein